MALPPPLLSKIHDDYLFVVARRQNGVEVLSFPPAGAHGKQALWHVYHYPRPQNIPFALEKSDVGGLNLIKTQGGEKITLFQNITKMTRTFFSTKGKIIHMWK
jgi:hypothetical protein